MKHPKKFYLVVVIVTKLYNIYGEAKNRKCWANKAHTVILLN